MNWTLFFGGVIGGYLLHRAVSLAKFYYKVHKLKKFLKSRE